MTEENDSKGKNVKDKTSSWLSDLDPDKLKTLSGNSSRLSFAELYALGQQEAVRLQAKSESERLAFDKKTEADRLDWDRERERDRLESEGNRYEADRARAVAPIPKEVTALLSAMHLRLENLEKNEKNKPTSLEEQRANTLRIAVEDASGIVNRLSNKIDSVADIMLPRMVRGNVVAQGNQGGMSEEDRIARYKKLGISVP